MNRSRPIPKRNPRRKPTELHPLRGVKKCQKYSQSVLRPGKPYRATPEEWAMLRLQVYERAKGHCEFENCQRFVDFTVGEVHHVKHRSKGGADVLDNLIWACPRCHRKHHGEPEWSKPA